MNALGISLVWSMLQVSLFCLAGASVHLAARRFRRARGASPLCAVLMTAAAITLLSFSPWPRWWTLSDTRPAQDVPVALTRGDTSTTDQPPSSVLPASDETLAEFASSHITLSAAGFLSSLWGDVHDELAGEVGGCSDGPQWHWPAWLATAILVGAVVGAARMLLGWLALAKLLRATRRLKDPSLIELVNRLRRQLHCRREIELREMTTTAGSPAIVGWRRPVILLPADWREWTDATRLAILAHETAHVTHGDFLMWLTAQVGVVVNFYNPLVHWLSLRLRLEQELAADACGAALSGGPKTYATMLARLALDQDDSRPLWAGRPFFPTRGTLIRRIEMLHHQPAGEPRSPSRIGRAVLLTTLVATGLGISGLRGPTRVARAEDTATTTDTAAAEKQAPNTNLPRKFDSSYLPANAIAVLSFKPLKVNEATTVFEPVLNSFPQAASIAFAFSMTDNGVEEVRTIGLKTAHDNTSSSAANDLKEPAAMEIYRMRKPYDRQKLRVRIFGQAPDGVTETTCLGYPSFRALSESGHLVNYLLVDDRTLVIVRERDVPAVLAADAQSHPSWYDEWQKIAGSPLAFACDSAAMAKLEGKPADAQDQFILSVFKETTFVFGHVGCAPGEVKIRVMARCASQEKAEAATEVARGGVAILKAAFTTVPQIFEPSAMPKEFQSVDVTGRLSSTLSNLQVDRRDREVRAEATFDATFVTQVAEATKAVLARQSDEWNAREKEDEKAHIAKLGRLAKAFEAYRAEHGHYPPAAVIGPDGTTPHSWRVALLPYLGEQKLFDEYKLDEPWDSKHNKPLVEKVPNIYSTSLWSVKGNAEYFVVTGAGTLFDSDAMDASEGLSDVPGETILVLQSRQHVPWTKPVDIETTADHNVRRPFRGIGKGFYAAFADGTVKFVSKETDATTVRALFTKAGGEEVKLR